jgi:hypothetical protein
MSIELGHRGFVVVGFLLFVAATPNLEAAMSVSLQPSVPSPAAVGTIVTWNAQVSNADSGTLWYRFRARRFGGDYRVVRDYGPLSTLDWTASEHEGACEIEVSVRNTDTGDIAVASSMYQMTSRVTGGSPAISQTANPLVFLYSAPACHAESRMRVQFRSPDGYIQNTPYKPCREGLSMNFYLAGLRPLTQYTVQHVVDTGSEFQEGPALTLTTPDVQLQLAPYAVTQPPPTPVMDGILLQSTLSETTVATDLYGNLLWFYPGSISFLTRPEPGGFFFGIIVDGGADQSHQILRKFDLAGTTIQETNAARINEQLAALGRRQINGFHHEARTLPDGRIMVLASTEQIMTDEQGPGQVNVLGDMILVLDRDLEVLWSWDAFDHLDPRRMATLGETCQHQCGGGPPFHLASQANDWLHGNSLGFTPDGNILYSCRHQDWLIKIDYNNGEGSGDILWRLGKDGDFQFVSDDPYPWFSHQHDAGYVAGDNSTIAVFDNGNVRRQSDANANSRGQVLRLDEQNRMATFVLNADLRAYCAAVGSARQLPNGNYHFDLGWIDATRSESVETDPSGKIVYAIQVATQEYRSFRMRDLYTP